MRDRNPIATHPDEGDLVRFLDQQVSSDERRWLYEHLAECADCATRIEAVRERSQALSSLVGSLDADAAPDELTRARALAAARRAQARRAVARPWYAAGPARAAAMVALTAVATTLTVSPVRAWVADRWEALVGAEDLAPAVAVQPTGVLERGSVISFEPASETFVLEIESLQQTGSVTLQIRDVEQASAQVVGGSGEEILALPSGLRVTNSPGSTASYAFSLPTHLRLIQVFAGGKLVALIPVADVQLPWSQTVSLSAEDLAR